MLVPHKFLNLVIVVWPLWRSRNLRLVWFVGIALLAEDFGCGGDVFCDCGC